MIVRALVLNRPSKINKSPYLADVKILAPFDLQFNENVELRHQCKLDDNLNAMAHVPSLGVGGLAEREGTVWMSLVSSIKKRHSAWTICLAEFKMPKRIIYVGVLPLSANTITQDFIMRGYIPKLKNASAIKSEIKIDRHRFDLQCVSESRTCIIEVKTVPMANVYGRPLKRDEAENSYQLNSMTKCAYFPSGSLKKIQRTQDLIEEDFKTVSVRALDHVNKLASIKSKEPFVRCLLVFVVQRNDCSEMKINDRDISYLSAIRNAQHIGVEILAFSVKWHPVPLSYRFQKMLDVII